MLKISWKNKVTDAYVLEKVKEKEACCVQFGNKKQGTLSPPVLTYAHVDSMV